MVIQDRRIDLAQAHAAISSRYATKSDSGKYVHFSVDTNRLYLPGDTTTASISIQPATISEIDSIEIDFKGEVHTFGWVQSTSARPGGSQRRLQQEKQIFLRNNAMIQLPSMKVRQTAGMLHITQKEEDDPYQLEARSCIPLPRRVDSSSRVVVMPSIYHDSFSGSPAAMVTYHWKATVHRKGMLKSDERQWKPIMVLPTAQQPANDASYSLPLHYPPSTLYRRASLDQEIKKFVVKTTGLMTLELAVPDLKNWPIFRPVPVLVRLTMRAKSPSDLLEPSQFTLPTIPGASSDPCKPAKDQPQFVVQQTRQTRVTMSSSDMLQDRSICRCLWDNGHVGNGFTQQADGKGFEAGGREGSTPLADQRASEGLSHGWTWPSRVEAPPMKDITTPLDSKGSKSVDSSTSSSSSNASSSSKSKSFYYASTCTLIGRIFLAARPNIQVQHLHVVNQLLFFWTVEGVRNDIEAEVCAVNVNLGLNDQEAASIHRDELERAILNPEGLNENSTLLKGFHYDGPPPLSLVELDEQLPLYPGPSNTPVK